MDQDTKAERLKSSKKTKTEIGNNANLKKQMNKTSKKENGNEQNVDSTDTKRKRGTEKDASTEIKKKRKLEEKDGSTEIKKKRKLEEDDDKEKLLIVRADGKKSKKWNEDGEIVTEGVKKKKKIVEQPQIYLTCKDSLIKQDQLQKEQRDKRCLLIKNLPSSTTKDFLNKIAPGDTVDVRLMDMKSKKALGKKFAILEFLTEDLCKSNFDSIKSLVEKMDDEVVVDFVGSKKSSGAADMAFNQKGLFVSGLKPSTTRADIKSLFPTATSIDGSFKKTHDGQILDASNVAVYFSSSEECLKARTALEASEEFKYLRISFMRAGKRRCRKEAEKSKRKNDAAGRRQKKAQGKVCKQPGSKILLQKKNSST